MWMVLDLCWLFILIQMRYYGELFLYGGLMYLENMQIFNLQYINWWLESCELLVDYSDVLISCLDSHSDGTHSLQRINWWASYVMLNFSKSVLMDTKLVYILDEMNYPCVFHTYPSPIRAWKIICPNYIQLVSDFVFLCLCFRAHIWSFLFPSHY